MLLRRAGLCAVAILLLLASAEAKGPYGRIQVGLWTGGAYTNDATGKFSHCSAGASYVSGISVVVFMDASDAWALGFAHQNWQLDAGEAFPIDLTFDAQASFHVFGSAMTRNIVMVPMPSNSALMAQFRKASLMTALAKGQAFQFKLDGTAQLIPTLANCVAQMKTRGIASAGDFTVPRAPKSAVTPATGGGLKAESSQPSRAEIQIEAMALASNFILKTPLQNPKVLSPADTPATVAAAGAAWQSDEASGFVRIIPAQPNMKGLDVTAAVIAADAKDCKGKFASARKSELIDSDVVFQGLVSCEDSDGSRLAHYFIVPRAKGGFVMFSVMSNLKTEQARNITKDEKLVDFRKAALVAVTQ